jgi:hypothetical protein
MEKGGNGMPPFAPIIEREEKSYVALCPELDIAGETVEI